MKCCELKKGGKKRFEIRLRKSSRNFPRRLRLAIFEKLLRALAIMKFTSRVAETNCRKCDLYKQIAIRFEANSIKMEIMETFKA